MFKRAVTTLRLPLLCSLLSALTFSAFAQEHKTAEQTNYTLITIADGLIQPWAMAFLPNGDILVTERQGNIKVIRDNAILANNVAGVPEVYFAGQGGLMDVMLDKDFASNRTVYLSLAHGKRSANATQLVSAKLASNDDGYELQDLTVLFTAQPAKNTAHHHGARIAQMADRSLLMTVGDGFNYREQAQTLDNHFGKIIRVQADGKAPKNNPFYNSDHALPEIFSLGHRNQQALLVSNGTVYENEHGPKGGDEVNIIHAGRNYGWPIATFGIDYNGARISPFTSYPNMESPKVDWTPSIAPSSMAMHNGNLYVTSLAEKSIRKLSIKGEQIVDQGVVFSQLNERLRDIESSPNGSLYVLTDGDKARLIKILEE